MYYVVLASVPLRWGSDVQFVCLGRDMVHSFFGLLPTGIPTDTD